VGVRWPVLGPLVNHFALGPALAYFVDRADKRNAVTERNAWDAGVIAAARSFDRPHGPMGVLQAGIGAVAAWAVTNAGIRSIPLLIVVAFLSAVVAYWAVPTGWAAITCLAAPVKQRDAARRELVDARQQLVAQRAGYDKVLTDVRTEEREYREQVNANARRVQARLELSEALREGRKYVRQGLRVGVSGIAPEGRMDGWTNGVINNLEILGQETSELRSWGTRPAGQLGTTAEVRVEYERRLDVLERMIEARSW